MKEKRKRAVFRMLNEMEIDNLNHRERFNYALDVFAREYLEGLKKDGIPTNKKNISLVKNAVLEHLTNKIEKRSGGVITSPDEIEFDEFAQKSKYQTRKEKMEAAERMKKLAIDKLRKEEKELRRLKKAAEKEEKDKALEKERIAKEKKIIREEKEKIRKEKMIMEKAKRPNVKEYIPVKLRKK